MSNLNNMEKLSNHCNEIRKANSKEQKITCPKGKGFWHDLVYNNPIIHTVLESRESNNITRQEIFDTINSAERIVKILMWGFPDGGRGKFTARIIPYIAEISASMEEINEHDLPWKEYVRHYNRIIRFQGVGRSTANLFFFFFKVKCNGMEPVAITERVTKHFAEFEEFNGINPTTTYLRQLQVFNDLAKKYKVTVEQIEYYLQGLN